MARVKYVYLIRRVSTSWDGCNGAETSIDYLNWVFGSKERADAKCKYFNENNATSGPGFRNRYEVYKQSID